MRLTIVPDGLKVFIYFNIHKQLFSVKAMEGEYKGLIIKHTPSLVLTDAVFKVSEAGRQRVLKEKQKNVHAGVVGYWCNDNPHEKRLGSEITYNPYRYSTFVFADTQEEAESVPSLVLRNKKVFVNESTPFPALVSSR